MNIDNNPSGNVAFSRKQFCQRNSIGTTKFYQELKDGRLSARKVGKRTIVLASDEALWRDALPVIGRA